RQRRAAAMRDMPLIICANRRNLRIKNVCYQSVTDYAERQARLAGGLRRALPALYSFFTAGQTGGLSPGTL
ncbi:MAG: hypothetical protein ACOX9E_04775, partial [Lentisphaeria bacterium]